MSRANCRPFSWLGLALAACSTAPPAPAPPPPRPTATEPPAAAPPELPSPGRIVHLPERLDDLVALERSTDGSCFAATRAGERLRFGPRPAGAPPSATEPVAGCGPVERVAPALGMPLHAAVKIGARWTFFSSSASFTVDDPLASPSAFDDNGEWLRGGSSDGAEAVVFGGALELRRLVAGKLEPLPAPVKAPYRLGSVGVRGRAILALATPEQLFASEDAGATWQLVALPHVGGSSVVRTEQGLALQGVHGAITWEPTGGALRVGQGFAKVAKLPVPAGRELLRPSLLARSEGRAAFVGAEWVEVSTDDKGTKLLHGVLGKPLAAVALDELTDCETVSVAGAMDHLVLACEGEAGVAFWSGRLSQLAARAPGLPPGDAALKRIASGTRGERLQMVVSATGALLVQGACLGVAQATCDRAVYLVSPGKPHVKSVFPDTPEWLPGLAFSADGSHAYALGSRAKDYASCLWVSSDGGAHFLPRPLTMPAGGDLLSADITSALSVGEDGAIGALLTSGDAGELVPALLDESGEVTAVGKASADWRPTAIYGRHALRLSGATLEESADGGVTWEHVAAPNSIERDLADIEVPMACGFGGCVLGASVARAGWGAGGASESLPELPAPKPLPRMPARRFECELGVTQGGAPWTKLDAEALPTDGDLAKGRVLWWVQQQSRGASVTMAELPASGAGPARIVKKELFPRGTGTRVQPRMASQFEGVTVVREGAPLKGLEVRWIDFFQGLTGRATIAPAGTPAPAFVPAVSMASGGAFVRARPDGVSGWYLKNGSASPLEAPPFPPELAGLMTSGFTAAAGAPIFTGSLRSDDGTTQLAMLLSARDGGLKPRPGAEWRRETTTLVAPADLGFAELQLTYFAKGEVGVYFTVVPPGEGPSVKLMRIRADGTFSPPEEGPNPMDLGATPRPCGAKDHAAGGRVHFSATLLARLRDAADTVDVLPPAQRRPTDPVESFLPPRMRTGGVVVAGTKASPCLAAIHVPSTRGRAAIRFVSVLGGDPRHSWLFRQSFAGGNATEVRPMSCKVK